MTPKLCQNCAFNNMHCAHQARLDAGSTTCLFRVEISNIKTASTSIPLTVIYPDGNGGHVTENYSSKTP